MTQGFEVAAAQIDDRDVVRRLAQAAAVQVGGQENVSLCWGANGLFAAAGAPVAAPPAWAGNQVLGAINAAIIALQGRNHNGPYAVLLTPAAALGLGNNREELEELIGASERIVMCPADPAAGPLEGLVMSLGAGAVDVVTIDPPAVAMRGYGIALGGGAPPVATSTGDLQLNVEERFALRIMDNTALAAF